jgi:hypothetical protein
MLRRGDGTGCVTACATVLGATRVGEVRAGQTGPGPSCESVDALAVAHEATLYDSPDIARVEGLVERDDACHVGVLDRSVTEPLLS